MVSIAIALEIVLMNRQWLLKLLAAPAILPNPRYGSSDSSLLIPFTDSELLAPNGYNFAMAKTLAFCNIEFRVSLEIACCPLTVDPRGDAEKDAEGRRRC